MPDLVLRPSPQQWKFLTADVHDVCYGGARGGGKSWVVRVKAMQLAHEYPGIKILIVRRTFRELDNNHIQPLLEMLHGQAAYNRQDKRFTFPNKSTISFLYCDSEGDLGMYQGAEYHVIFLDESTQLKQEWIEKIRACCRSADSIPKRVYYTCNPGGESHTWHKDRFVDRKKAVDSTVDNQVFIKALPTDNKALMESTPEYIAQLEALPPKLRAAWLEGSWDIFEGCVFEEFTIAPDNEDRRWTHVLPAEGFKVPNSWEVYRSFDWGFRRPFSVGYWTVDYDGVIYRIAEYYGCQRDVRTGESIPNEGLKWDPDKVFREVNEFENNHPLLKGRQITGVADPAIWDAEMGMSVADHAIKHGIYFTPGDHKRIAGWMQCHYRLQFDADGYPRMYVLDSCKDFLRTVPSLQYDDHKVEEVDTNGEDHIADEWRYFCMSRPIAPMEAVKEYKPKGDPLDMFTRY